MSTLWLHYLADFIFYRRLIVFRLPISDYAWTEQQFMQLVSTFADVYFDDVSPPLESVCYSGPHAWYIKENVIKQARQKKARQKGRKKKKTIRTNTDTVANDLYSK